MRNQGYLNKFLCACVDSESNGTKFMTVVYVNGQSTSDENLKKLLTSTGFFTNTDIGSRDFGKWFKSGRLPEFISERTYQYSKEAAASGWKFKKEHFPDMWIHPDDSFVLNVNAGEIVTSTDFSAGCTLRFARINRIRAKDFGDDPKSAKEVENSTNLHDLFYQRQFQQQDAERESQSQSQQYNFEFGDGVAENKFRSMEQGLKKRTFRKKRPRAELNVRLPNTHLREKAESKIFAGYVFMVLDGKYTLERNNLEKKQARSEGWYKEARKVKCQQDVINFVLKNGGKIVSVSHDDADFVIGGSIDDARVCNYQRAIERAQEPNRNRKKDASLQKMVQLGVIKWTFLYATYHQQNTMKMTEEKAVFAPRKHDYLMISKCIQDRLENIEDIYGMHLDEDSSMFEFKRALKEVKIQNFNDSDGLDAGTRNDHDATKSSLQWQYQLDTSLTIDEKVNEMCFISCYVTFFPM